MTSKPTWNDRLRKVSAFPLLAVSLFYFLITPNQVTFHEFLHDHSHEDCTVEAEKDPCHQKIYHNKTNEGCDHHSHMHKPTIQCDLSVIFIFKPDFISADSDIPYVAGSWNQGLTTYSENWNSINGFINKNKGPPFNICS